jgi:hypothetical protein
LVEAGKKPDKDLIEVTEKTICYSENVLKSLATDMRRDRPNSIYGHYPLKAAFDGGFTSNENLAKAKGNGGKDAGFSEGRGVAAEFMCRSKRGYKWLRDFCAGIE